MLCERCVLHVLTFACRVCARRSFREPIVSPASKATRPISSSHLIPKSLERSLACQGQLQVVINEVVGRPLGATPLRS